MKRAAFKSSLVACFRVGREEDGNDAAGSCVGQEPIVCIKRDN